MIRSTQIRNSLLIPLTVLAALAAVSVQAQPEGEAQLQRAQELIAAMTAAGGDSIPVELIQRARGIAVVPNVIRGGFVVGARRGRGVLSVRLDDGSWSNPAFITLTGGSIGWQVGADSTDVVLIFANDNAIINIADGKFTLGGEATAIAGPLRKHASSTMTFRAEVYGYQISRGLYAGAAFQGARLKIDYKLGFNYYRGLSDTAPLGHQTAATPVDASNFLSALEQAEFEVPAMTSPEPKVMPADDVDPARTFPLPD
jgi:lipid-binding SYLF domain-containing protein